MNFRIKVLLLLAKAVLLDRRAEASARVFEALIAIVEGSLLCRQLH